MFLSISAVELILTFVAGVSALVLYVRQDDRYHWAFAAFVCAVVATAISPADPMSMILMSIIFFGFFTFGTRYRRAEKTKVGDLIAIKSIGSLQIAIGIASLAVCVLAVGRLYSATLAEPMFGYQAFRVWATNVTSIGFLAVACIVWLHGLLFRRPDSDRLEHN
ncbi:hypothetical protein Mal15_69300 [Stieleria maiorica]|uniref:Transmembrane protein n=1 Tax=Stieleria maiorica TaxID=2795974 RepID=A0A5B9MN53_9BACT|nr:hypothetical protein [Stieleria maiorica]QEG02809.1 hypothetical protein Mal15_69300 [Stieleria maiorica]